MKQVDVDHPLEWFLDRLNNVRSTNAGYSAQCPAHDDRKNSLGLMVNASGEVIVNCLAGCSFGDIMSALESQDPVPQIVIKKITPGNNGSSSSTVPLTKVEEWWSKYTGIPATFWSEWGVLFTTKGIDFTWPSTPVRKSRSFGKKEFFWSSGACPLFWPEFPERAPKVIYLTEGESDCGVLRYIGLDAWAVAKGADVSIPDVWAVLKTRGVEEVRILSMSIKRENRFSAFLRGDSRGGSEGQGRRSDLRIEPPDGRERHS